MYPIQRFDEKYTKQVISFLERCLPESGRKLDLEEKHKCFLQPLFGELSGYKTLL